MSASTSAHVGPDIHEADADLIWARYGLSPYWALSKLIQVAGGGTSIDVELETADGTEEWHVTLSSHKGGIAPRDDDDLDVDRLREFWINAYGRGERKISYHIAPRFPGMKHWESGDDITSPFDHGVDVPQSDETSHEGVNVTARASNLALDEYTALLPRFLQLLADQLEFDLADYFTDRPNPHSNITALEQYLRINRSIAQKLLRADGPFRSLFDLLADREGSKVVYSADNEEIVGYNHSLRFSDADAREMIPTHSYGKQLKYYHPREVGDRSPDDPLYHPKLGALFKSNWTGATVYWHERDEVAHELEETLLNVLSWSDVPVDPDPTTFVADDHFDVEASERDVGFYDDPTPEIELDQGVKLVHVLNKALTDSDEQLLQEVATDGGQHYRESELPTSTLYECLDRLDGILESDDGVVRFVSEHIRQEVSALVERVDRVVDSAADAVAGLLDLDRETIRQEGGALQSWLAEYGAELVDREGTDVLDVGVELSKHKSRPMPQLKEVLAYLRKSWARTGRPQRNLDDVVLAATIDGEHQELPISIAENVATPGLTRH